MWIYCAEPLGMGMGVGLTFHHLLGKQSLVFSSLIANGGTEDEVAATRSRGDDGKHEEIFLVGCKKKYIVTKIGYL
jgi:hypothetical protein